ncbi:MAG: polysaccharide biosynthesis protein [Spirochaetes bacterium]|nr:MAG: polysaccharide biosynthesis protein [Spirochaetota bacterium]
MTENRIVIIGAGFAGRSIASEIKLKGVPGKVVAFIDDDSQKIGKTLEGIPVYGPINDIKKIIKKAPAEEALIAIPGASRKRLKEIYSVLKTAKFVKIRILPGISQIVDGDAHLIQTREIYAQDLLGRDPVLIPLKKSLTYLRGKRVLITGAGGSIGSELSRQLLFGGAQRLYLFGHGENSIYEVERDLRILQEEGVGEKAIIVPIIGELKDRNYMHFILNRLRADVIFHCAAYKHVPMLEANPIEAVKNNVFGTLNLLDSANTAGTSRFVFISTDKAVDPISIYGASKLIAEKLVLSNNQGKMESIVVRFGNVLGSRGSIVPLFRKQILKGGPVTITHPESTRFFMTIPEAASLVLKAGGVGKGNNLYILEMGEPLLIKELAEQMIRFYGYEPEKEIALKYIGLRPGEKISEKLCSSYETPQETEFPGIKRLLRNGEQKEPIECIVNSLRPVCYFDPLKPEVYRNRKVLKAIIKRYIPTLEIPDNEPEY